MLMQTKTQPGCGICRATRNILISLYATIVRPLYVFLFARPSMQAVNDVLLDLALRGKGYKNCCDPEATGEEIFLKLLSAQDPRLCIDIGANKGLYSELLLELTQCKVIAFEPLPKAFDILSGLKARFPDRLVAVNKGVGDVDAELDLHFAEQDSVLASFSIEADEVEYVGNRNTMKVEVTTLDRFLETATGLDLRQIDLIKIDTEGYEYEVLVGARETIEKWKPKFIQIEYNWHQMFKAQSLHRFASLLPDYVPYQLVPYGKGLTRVDARKPESNIYHYSNFVFARADIAIETR